MWQATTTDDAGAIWQANGGEDQSFDAVMETEFYGGTFNLLERRQAIGFHGEISFDMTGLDMGGLGRRFIGDEIRISIEAEFLREGS